MRISNQRAKESGYYLPFSLFRTEVRYTKLSKSYYFIQENIDEQKRFIHPSGYSLGDKPIECDYASPCRDRPRNRISTILRDQGSEELNRQIRDLQQDVQQNSQPKIDLETPNPQSTLEQKEEALENELQIHQEGPKLETVPTPEESLGLDDNQPFQPENQEIEIKF